MRIYLDIETLPPERDDPLILDRTDRLTDEEYRKLALGAEYGRLLCIGLIVEVDGRIKYRGLYGRDRQSMRFHMEEARTLRSFWNLVRDFNKERDLFIGHNILDFDLHFICQRSVIKRVQPSIEIPFARFRSKPIFDVMWEFEHWRRHISLDQMARIMGLGSSKQAGIDGSRVYDYFLEGRHQEIADYCLRDVELVRSIYQRIKFISTET
jgi:hypothetical protein